MTALREARLIAFVGVDQLRLPGEYLTGWTAPSSPANVARPRIAELRAAGYTYGQIARRLNHDGVSTPSGRGQWHPTTAQRHLHPAPWAARMRQYRARQ